MGGQNTPAAWFPDPTGAPLLRWWDGAQWTSATAPAPELTRSPKPTETAASVTDTARHGGLFGAKRQLEEENLRLQQALGTLGVTERDQLRAELTQLRNDLPVLRAEQVTLTAAIEPLRAETVGLQSARAELFGLRTEVADLQGQRAALGREIEEMQELRSQRTELLGEVARLRRDVIETQETTLLQEVGIYRYRHPLDDAIAYKVRLTGIQAQIRDAVKAGTAVKGSTSWTVNGSAREGSKMVREFSKLMLRAYNAEADNAVRSMKPYTLESAVARLEKARDTIVKLGGTMNIRVADGYHGLRVSELELTADYLAKAAEEKDRDRAERERLREEEKARREIEREQERLRKEQEHYQTVVAAYQSQGNHAAAADAQLKLTEINEGIDGLNRRAANIRAGYIYVISNIGAFGAKMVKVGLTRRLDPMDRVRELGDASVPFRYDVHLLAFNEDAVGLETHLHHALADRRVNVVNARREFFYATPGEVRDILSTLDLSLLSYVEDSEALEWRQSQTTRINPTPVAV